MQERKLSPIDIFYAIKEMNFLEGSVIGGMRQSSGGFEISFTSDSPAKGFGLRVSCAAFHMFPCRGFGRKSECTGFFKTLEKRITGAKFSGARQHGMSGTVEIHAGEYIVICELLGKTNFIVCDRDYTIIDALESYVESMRQVAPGAKYRPPASPEITGASLHMSGNMMTFLSYTIGNNYLAEAVMRAGTEKAPSTREYADRLACSVRDMLSETPSPCIVKSKKKIIDAVPFDFVIYTDYEKTDMRTFNEALFRLFSGKAPVAKRKSAVKTVRRIRKQQKSMARELGSREQQNRKTAEIIFRNISLVDSVLTGIRRARSSCTWEKIRQDIESGNMPYADSIARIDEHKGRLMLKIENHNIEIDMRLSAAQNAEMYFEIAKSAKGKLEKTICALSSRVRLKKRDEKKPVTCEIKNEAAEKKRWFEDFRYFYSSDGFMIVCGKDAESNETLLKKHLEKNDIVLHAEIHGAPFVVVKPAQKGDEIIQPSPQSIKEAAEVAACFSKAWATGIGNASVFWVGAGQVSKSAPGGVLGKGSFVVSGQKNYLKKIPLKIAIGITPVGSLIGGPLQSVGKRCRYFVTITPGNTDGRELAGLIKKRLLQKAMPEDKEFIESKSIEQIAMLIPHSTGQLV